MEGIPVPQKEIDLAQAFTPWAFDYLYVGAPAAAGSTDVKIKTTDGREVTLQGLEVGRAHCIGGQGVYGTASGTTAVAVMVW